MAYNPFIKEDIRTCYFDYKQAVLLRFWLSRISTIRNVASQQIKLGLVILINRSTWSPAIKMQQLPLGTSHLIMGNSVVGVLQILRTAMILTVMAFVGATVAQLYRMVELMNPGRNVDVIILIGPNNVSRSSESEECQWEETLVCLLTAVWQKF